MVVTPKEEVMPGFMFQVIVPGDYSTQQLRDDAKADYGLDIHIRVRVGPTVVNVDGGSINCPIGVVDDLFLEGKFDFPIPAHGHCLYIGYFLPSKEE